MCGPPTTGPAIFPLAETGERVARMADMKATYLDSASGSISSRTRPPDDVLTRSPIETRELAGDIARMQIAPEQGTFMTMLTQLIGAGDAVEVGTFTGYSSLCHRPGLAAGGTLICCDVSEEWTGDRPALLGRRPGVADRIELRIGPAAETLRALPDRADRRPGVHRRRQGRLPRLLRGARAPAAPRRPDPRRQHALERRGRRSRADRRDTQLIREFNDMVTADERVDSSCCPSPTASP